VELYLKSFAEMTVNHVRLPEAFDKSKVAKLYERKLVDSISYYRKLLETTDADEIKSLSQTIRKLRKGGADGFEQLIEYMKTNDFPPVLWVECRRAKQTFVDSLQFMVERMERWFAYRPKQRGQSRRRNLLTKAMLHPFLPLFEAFASSFVDFSEMLLFIELWSCKDESELFTSKRWSLANVDQAAFDESHMKFNQGITSLRQAYFSAANRSLPRMDLSGPVSWAFEQLLIKAEV
jgi:hypothetical protein